MMTPDHLHDWDRFNKQLKETAQRLTCVEVIHRYDLLPRSAQGKTRFSIRCPNPAHEDSTPSCSIREASFKCFGCGVSGDVFELLGLLDGLEYFEDKLKRALEMLGIDHDVEREAFLEAERARSRGRDEAIWTPSSLDMPDDTLASSRQEQKAPKRHELASTVWAFLLEERKVSMVLRQCERFI